MKFWDWLTKSRYTRRLEREIERLELFNEKLERDNRQLLKALYPAMRTMEDNAPPPGEWKKPFKL